MTEPLIRSVRDADDQTVGYRAVCYRCGCTGPIWEVVRWGSVDAADRAEADSIAHGPVCVYAGEQGVVVPILLPMVEAEAIAGVLDQMAAMMPMAAAAMGGSAMAEVQMMARTITQAKARVDSAIHDVLAAAMIDAHAQGELADIEVDPNGLGLIIDPNAPMVIE